MNKYIKYKHIATGFTENTICRSRNMLCGLNLLILAIYLYFMYLFHKIQYISIHVCCGLFYIISQTCYFTKNGNSPTVEGVGLQPCFVIVCLTHYNKNLHITYNKAGSKHIHVHSAATRHYLSTKITMVSLSNMVY